eukprot:532547-Hanusia_phi.AAC.1
MSPRPGGAPYYGTHSGPGGSDSGSDRHGVHTPVTVTVSGGGGNPQHNLKLQVRFIKLIRGRSEPGPSRRPTGRGSGDLRLLPHHPVSDSADTVAALRPGR